MLKYGRNSWGGPLFRIAWTEDRTIYGLGAQIPKYPGKHCWVLERWCPPSKYGSRQSWEAVKDYDPASPTFLQSVLGPYPARGDYEQVYVFEELPSSSNLPRAVVELVARLIEAGKAHTRSTRWAAVKAAMDKKEKDWQKFFDDFCADRLSAPSMRNAEINTGQTSKRKIGPDFHRFKKSTKDLPKWLPQTGFVQMPADMKRRVMNLSDGETVQ